MRWILLPCCLLAGLAMLAQGTADAPDTVRSSNGWYLSPHGTIRVLVIFAEVEYDKHPELDPQPTAPDHWPKGGLPVWKDDLFDPFGARQFRDFLTNRFRLIGLGKRAQISTYPTGQCRNRNQCMACIVINQLCINMF